jgi:hypothetical protein
MTAVDAAPRYPRASMARLVLCCSMGGVQSAPRWSTAGRQLVGISRVECSRKRGLFCAIPENKFEIGWESLLSGRLKCPFSARRSTGGRQPAGISRAKSEKSEVILRDPENRLETR